MPTIRDVALRAGVSLGTASYVLNGRSGVSERRRKLVLEAARDIGYRPNQLARGLRQQRTDVFGLCAPMISSAYFSELIEQFDALSAEPARHLMQVLSGGDSEREYQRVESLISRRVDGILLMPTINPERTLDLLAENHVPAVIVDRILDEPRFDLVLLDHAGAMREVVRHLMDQGHRRILFVVRHPDLVTTRARIDVLNDAVAEAGSGFRADIIVTTREQEELHDLLAAHLRGRSAPTAIVTSNSINTLWTLRFLRSLEVRIPDDVSIVAYDEPGWGELVAPPLTVVRQPTARIAEAAWRLLTERIALPEAPRRRIMLSSELVVRGSTARSSG
jgi:LacI family transcriptional regulator